MSVRWTASGGGPRFHHLVKTNLQVVASLLNSTAAPRDARGARRVRGHSAAASSAFRRHRNHFAKWRTIADCAAPVMAERP